MENKQEIQEGVLAEFEKLTKIPRKSGHEKAVSDFLYGYLKDLGFKVVQDEVLNIIADKPADKGYENAPLTILQGHMDMVCVADEGVDYDPLTDPIKLQRDEKYLHAVGTSLGADDGIGVAEAIHILKTAKNHGPLRMIVTVDEEVGMRGATHLEKQYLLDAAYLINCDSENYDELTVGSAGGIDLSFHRSIHWQAPEKKMAWTLSVKGLLGGHSGEQINAGRGNAIRTLAMTLLALEEKGIAFELASFDGGKARNAIPSSASVVLLAEKDQQAVIEAVLADQKARFVEMYGGVDPNLSFVLQGTELPKRVFSAEDTASLLYLLSAIHTGVYAMSQVVPGLVETSANLGVVKTQQDHIEIQVYPRSAIDQKLDEFARMAKSLAAMTGFAAQIGAKSPGWKERKDSKLAKIMADTFAEQNGRSMKVETIHAGLECGWHFRKNPKLDMVSIGVTTENIHSPQERLLLSTIAPQVELIVATLHKIAEEK